MIPHSVGVVSLVSGLTLGVVGLAGTAASVINDPDAKVIICHATRSENNPYNKIKVDHSAVDDRGHRHHNGPVWYPGAKDDGVHWGDIIPPIGDDDGLNWAEGEAVYDNDCLTSAPVSSTADEAKVTICHRTNSEVNPYNRITVSVSAVAEGGHRHHTGPVWYPGAKDDGVRWGDIIPPTGGVAPMNWPAGESVFNNGCEVPGTTDNTTKRPPKTSDDDDDDDVTTTSTTTEATTTTTIS